MLAVAELIVEFGCQLHGLTRQLKRWKRWGSDESNREVVVEVGVIEGLNKEIM
ncbi:12136_t:CDS:2, partial [Dentiscutata heterogama]